MARPAKLRGAVVDSAPAVTFGPDSEAWRLNREAMLLLGAGPRALLLQIAHPAIAEGVDRFSGFREDPWSRLRATIGSYLQIVYGSPGEADAEITRLARLHGVIRGPVRDREARARGFVAFDATDPELSLWVHATLVESTIVAFDAWIEPLSREQRERYYAETVPLGLAFGIPAERLPANLAGLEAYVGEMIGAGGPVAPTPLARELSETILHPPLGTVHSALASVRPLLDAIPAAVYDWTLWPSIGLLPGRIREAYGIPFGTFERAVAAWLVGGWRAWRPLLPAAFRHMPQARAADHRIARRGISSSAGSASGRWARGRAGSPRQGP